MDIFQLEPSLAYTGSYTDLIFTGSLPNRGLAYSHLSGSVEVYSQYFYSDYLSFISESNKKLSNLGVRFVQLKSPNQRYYDSFVPTIHQIVPINNGQLTLNQIRIQPLSSINIGISYRYLFGGIVNGRAMTITASTNLNDTFREQISDNIWLRSFPFEYRYRNVARVDASNLNSEIGLNYHTSGVMHASGQIIYGGSNNSFNTTLLVEPAVGTPSSDPFWKGSTGQTLKWGPQVGITYILSGSPEGITYNFANLTEMDVGDLGFPGTPIVSQGPFPPTPILNPTKDITQTGDYSVMPGATSVTIFIKHLYGFGDEGQYGSVGFLNGNYVVEGSTYHRYGIGDQIRGWKYGLYSGFPYFSKAIFRQDRYGHFRDMIEQQQYTKFYDTIGIKENGQLGGSIGTTNAMVDIKFISGSLSYITASDRSLNLRDSGIYDFEAKSGQPWTDMDRL